MRGLFYLMTVMTHLAKAILAMRAYQSKLDEAALREELLEQKARENEEKIKLASNRVLASDMEIEIQKLKIMKMERELGVNGPEWKPDNY